MKAAYYDRFGSVDVLNVGDLPAPRPASGEVLVRVAAAALNPKDVLVRKGKFRLVSGRHFPRIPGYDFAGTVEQLGAGVSGVALGDEVYGMVNAWSGGTCAELVAVPAGELAPLLGEKGPRRDHQRPVRGIVHESLIAGDEDCPGAGCEQGP